MRTSIIALVLLLPSFSLAQEEDHSHHNQHSQHAAHAGHDGKVFQLPSDCGPMEAWDSVTAMCMPFPNGHEMSHVMLHGNVFGGSTWQSGSRGQDSAWSTQMLMANYGRTAGENHFLNIGLMATFEKWTLPDEGYPLILQTGEANHDGFPYVDAQHPHSSPVMGLTLSDTIRIGGAADRNFVRLFFAPRGQSTDGPITFMHRPTGVANPDAPLGHHIGQDVGHISSTVIGGALKLGNSQFEVSAFNGAEPEPDEVDLPIAGPNSLGFRLTQFFADDFFVMGSFAYVDEPHPHSHQIQGSSAIRPFDEQVTSATRYGASAYSRHALRGGGNLHTALIYGSVKTFGVDTFRHSFSHEVHLQGESSSVFTRVEVLQRLPAELLIANSLDPKWVTAATLGYSHVLARLGPTNLRFGGSATKSFLPQEFEPTYGGDPWSAKVFLQLGGMKMF